MSLLTRRIDLKIPAAILFISVDVVVAAVAYWIYLDFQSVQTSEAAHSGPQMVYALFLLPFFFIANMCIAIARKGRDKHPFLLAWTVTWLAAIAVNVGEVLYFRGRVQHEFALLVGLVELASLAMLVIAFLITLMVWGIVVWRERRKVKADIDANDSGD